MTDFSFCQQRSLKQLFNEPPIRFTPMNPYLSNTVTNMQLNMRRKAEILKYMPNKSSTQTNNLTKKEQFALLAKGGSTYSHYLFNKTNVDCSGDRMIMTPTTACDVPGPITYLYNDETVPLYNYSDYNTRTYPSYVDANTDPWQFVVQPDVIVSSTSASNIYYLIIQNTVDQPVHYYTITMPVGLSITGVVSDFSGDIAVSLKSLSLDIYYGKSLVKRIDVSNNQLSNLAFTLNLNNTTSFSAKQFVGNLVFPEISLYTTPTYVYSFVLTAIVNVAPTPTNKISSALIANMTTIDNTVTGSGCTLVSNNTPSVNSGASITGR